MSILIKKDYCIGCNKCVNVCPGNLIRLGEDQKAYIKYPQDCWGCTSCLKECPVSAIKFFLGADIGGRGSFLDAIVKEDTIEWVIEKQEGLEERISINRRESNKY